MLYYQPSRKAHAIILRTAMKNSWLILVW